MPRKISRDGIAAPLGRDILRHVKYSLGKEPEDRTPSDVYHALALSVRDRLLEGMLSTEERYRAASAKRLCYLSLEFLIGRALGTNLLNLGLLEAAEEAARTLGADLAALREEERDAALGNGGLGRLAACFLDSLATRDLPGFGYGLFYQFGLFKQEMENGYQKELPDDWLAGGNPWLVERRDEAILVPLYGRVTPGVDLMGGYNPMWVDWRLIVGVPYDMPVAGFGGRTVNYLRLFAAKPSSQFDVQIFNEGDYIKAVSEKIAVESVSKILYPSDTVWTGRELRLVQEYFLVACTLRDIFRRYLKTHKEFDAFPDQVAIHLNDTHPSLAVAELMRLLVDEYGLDWEHAWDITNRSLAYTNHTLLPEALEKWPVSLLGLVLPRHLEIIYEINRRFLEQVARRWPGENGRLAELSLVEERPEKQIRMAHLAVVGAHSVNGVSELHTRLLKESVLPGFHQLWPERFNNKTNGITPRRWLLKANPGLAGLITGRIGPKWITDLDLLRQLEPLADEPEFQREFLAVKQVNKSTLAGVIAETTGVSVNPEGLFSIQAKRIHEYKRQLLNLLNIVHDYLVMVEDGLFPPGPKTCVFAGKAAPGYWIAKQIIKLIGNVAGVINADRRTRGMLKVVFVPDYRVSLAERIISAADLSEQISTAGKEASGTGNMKFALNGALTMGTLDGANIEILAEVGRENIYIFGLTSEEVADRLARGHDAWALYRETPALKRVLDAITTDRFSAQEPGIFGWIRRKLLDEGDPYLHLADFEAYHQAQRRALADYQDRPAWARRAILNVARLGRFSSDRTIAEYAKDIWQIKAV